MSLRYMDDPAIPLTRSFSTGFSYGMEKDLSRDVFERVARIHRASAKREAKTPRVSALIEFFIVCSPSRPHVDRRDPA